jgi:hypothetical protein
MAGGPFENKGYMGLGGYGVPGSGIEGGVPQAPSQTPSWMSGGPPPIRSAPPAGGGLGGFGGGAPPPPIPAQNAAAWQAAKAKAAMGPPAGMQQRNAAALAARGRAPGMGMAQPARGAAPKPMSVDPAMAGRLAGAQAAMAKGAPSAGASPLQGKMNEMRANPQMTGAFATGKMKMPGMP